MSRNIAIVGTGDGWQECPFDRESWVIAKSIMMKTPPKRIDMMFNMDPLDEMASFDKHSRFRAVYTKEEFIKRINEIGVPFVTSKAHPDVKRSLEFPLKEVFRKYGVMYFTNTISFMIAYAMYLGVDSIEFWGVNQAGAMEYLTERKGVEFWLGLAAGTGVRIEIKGNSPLLHDPLVYGYRKTEGELIDSL
jgi:hypothetical protein